MNWIATASLKNQPSGEFYVKNASSTPDRNATIGSWNATAQVFTFADGSERHISKISINTVFSAIGLSRGM